jgi:CubicO group peptidase (beta-lactamase class C family)
LRQIARLAGLAALVIVAAALLAVLRDPAYARRYLRALTIDVGEPPLDWYAPAETVRGSGAQPLPRAEPESLGLDRAVLLQAAEWAEARESQALVVMRDGHVVFERYWRGFGPQTEFSAHSFHKTLAALLVGVAIQDGHVDSIDETAARWLPEWRGDERKSITLRHLASMASGLEPPDFGYLPWSTTVSTYIATDLAAANLRIPAAAAAGTRFGHHNPDVVALSVVIERATGRRYAEYLSDRLWRPLGAADARIWLDREGGLAHADCCFLARSEDWLRVAELMRNGGLVDGRQVVPAGWIETMLAPSAAEAGFGMQVWLARPFRPRRVYTPVRMDVGSSAREPIGDQQAWFLDGWGYRRLWVLPAERLVVLRLGTQAGDWDDTVLPNLALRSVIAPTTGADATDPPVT